MISPGEYVVFYIWQMFTQGDYSAEDSVCDKVLNFGCCSIYSLTLIVKVSCWPCRDSLPHMVCWWCVQASDFALSPPYMAIDCGSSAICILTAPWLTTQMASKCFFAVGWGLSIVHVSYMVWLWGFCYRWKILLYHGREQGSGWGGGWRVPFPWNLKMMTSFFYRTYSALIHLWGYLRFRFISLPLKPGWCPH